MSCTASLRAQHDAVEVMFDEIFDDLAHYRSERDAFPLSLKLARLAGILRTHFRMEDELLYPRMIASDSREAAVLARVFQGELGHLASRFDRFLERWSSSDAIAGAVRQFRFEAGMLFAAIRERIHRENRDLFPLADVAMLRRAGLVAVRGSDAAEAPLTA